MLNTRIIAMAVAGVLACGQAVAEDKASDADQAEATFDLAVGEDLYKKNCRQCHGPTAKGLASYPKLVDQTPEYLIDKLERYRAGERFGPNTALMAPRAKKLSDEDIVNISYFIDSLK